MNNCFSCILADDEPTILLSLANSPIWEEQGIKIIAKEDNGQGAFESIQNLKPDFAILDIRMPGLSGLDVLKKCAETGSRTQIIIISGFDDFSYAKDALKYGAKAYILKPIDYTELSDELRILGMRLNNERNAIDQVKHPATTFFKDLIEGRVIDSSLIVKLLPSLNEALTDTSCYVMFISFSSTLSNEAYEKTLPLLETCLEKIRHKIWFRDAKSLVGIFNFGTETSYEVASAFLELLTDNDYPDTVIGIGDVVPGLYQCPYSYNKALSAVTYRLYSNDKHIFTSLDICTIPPPDRNPLQNVDMVSFILTGNLDKIEKGVKQFMETLLYVPMPSPNYVYSLCYSFAENVSSSLRPVLPEGAVKSIYKEIPLYVSLDGLIGCLSSYFADIEHYIESLYGMEKASLILEETNGIFEDDDELIRKAKLYIRENIQNKIYISDIACNANLSESYFAIYFKNKTGQTLRDYLLKEKMEWAGKILLEKNINIEDIASRLGYSDYHAFSRAFKKIYGKTPSTFRLKAVR